MKTIILRIKKLVRICTLTAIGIVVASVVFTFVCNIWVIVNAGGKTFDDVADVPYRRCGLLLGISPITSDGAPNSYFENRINAAEELYKAGKIYGIIASGFYYSNPEHDLCSVVDALCDSLIARGIPADRIVLDSDGQHTVHSIIKAKERYGIDSVLIISQKEHNQRAIYLAEYYGLNAVGYNAQPSSICYDRIKNDIREYFARVKMFFELWFGSKPKLLSEELMELMEEYRNSDQYLRNINSVAGHDERDTIVGNFTGKGIDTIYVYQENHFPDENDYGQHISYYAKSNNPEIPTIELWGWDQVSPKLVYEGDVDSNGKDEWGYLHTWMASQWRQYRIFTLVGNEWRYLIDGELLDTHGLFRSSGVDIVEKGDRKGYVKINYARWEADDMDTHDTIVAATYTKITKENK